MDVVATSWKFLSIFPTSFYENNYWYANQHWSYWAYHTQQKYYAISLLWIAATPSATTLKSIWGYLYCVIVCVFPGLNTHTHTHTRLLASYTVRLCGQGLYFIKLCAHRRYSVKIQKCLKGEVWDTEQEFCTGESGYLIVSVLPRLEMWPWIRSSFNLHTFLHQWDKSTVSGQPWRPCLALCLKHYELQESAFGVRLGFPGGDVCALDCPPLFRILQPWKGPTKRKIVPFQY